MWIPRTDPEQPVKDTEEVGIHQNIVPGELKNRKHATFCYEKMAFVFNLSTGEYISTSVRKIWNKKK